MPQLSRCSEPLLAAAAAKSSLQLCPTLCDPIGGSPPAPLSLGFFRQEYWSGLSFPFPPCSLQLEKSPRSNKDPAQPQINTVFLKSVHVYIVLLEWLKKKKATMHSPVVSILEFFLLVCFLYIILLFSPCFKLLWSYHPSNSVSSFLNLNPYSIYSFYVILNSSKSPLKMAVYLSI